MARGSRSGDLDLVLLDDPSLLLLGPIMEMETQKCDLLGLAKCELLGPANHVCHVMKHVMCACVKLVWYHLEPLSGPQMVPFGAPFGSPKGPSH